MLGIKLFISDKDIHGHVHHSRHSCITPATAASLPPQLRTTAAYYSCVLPKADISTH